MTSCQNRASLLSFATGLAVVLGAAHEWPSSAAEGVSEIDVIQDGIERADYDLRGVEGLWELLIPWLPNCESSRVSEVLFRLDLGKSLVELVRSECVDRESACGCCVRFEFFEIGVSQSTGPFRRQVCGAMLPRPPLSDFIGECGDEELCFSGYSGDHHFASGLRERECIQRLSNGQLVLAFLRDRQAVNGMTWDLMIIPIDDGRLALLRARIVWHGFLGDCDDGIRVMDDADFVDGPTASNRGQP